MKISCELSPQDKLKVSEINDTLFIDTQFETLDCNTIVVSKGDARRLAKRLKRFANS